MKAGFVGLVGLPNAGKSSLVNLIVGEKVGIVSAKPQTTRQKVIGIYNAPEAQYCFVDAPGAVTASSGLNAFLEKELEGVIEDSDVLLAVLNLDADRFEDLARIYKRVKASNKPYRVVITKQDLDPGHRLLSLCQELGLREGEFVSGSLNRKPEAYKDKVLKQLADLLPESKAPLFDPDNYTTSSARDWVAETVREKCFEILHQEVPYGTGCSGFSNTKKVEICTKLKWRSW